MPINLIIGRNNSGKSALLDLLELCTSAGKFFDPSKHARGSKEFEVLAVRPVTEQELRGIFNEGTRGGGVPGRNHWEYGAQFVGVRVRTRYRSAWKPEIVDGIRFNELHDHASVFIERLANAMLGNNPLKDMRVVRVSAERDVRPEARDMTLALTPDGAGITNIIRGFINQDNLPRDQVEVHLLNDLNIIFAGDSRFTRISCRENTQGYWEIFLAEQSKGEIRLSQSGSSLKSIFIILAYIRLAKYLEKISWRSVLFAVEEPENNLHPALLRRLMDYLADKQRDLGFTLFLTTHSPIGIDWCTRRDDAQIIHVTHNGNTAEVTTSSEYLSNRKILDDLDIRASDMLQANGIIWVEGPSDRIYVRRWIELFTDGGLKEGVHYNIVFYGGKLLSHLDAKPPIEQQKSLSILAVNRNAAILIDSDRHLGKLPAKGIKGRKPRMHINATKSRIKAEVEEIGGMVWITEGREVENYVKNSVYERVVGGGPLHLGIYDDIPDAEYLTQFKGDKISIAHTVAEALTRADLEDHLDLATRLHELVLRIRAWNNI
ncbi:AAA family ATPase [Rhizobium sp. CRIBSB]|nr:AAA family ATPase [Rhizobium sp. CRIBSB]